MAKGEKDTIGPFAVIGQVHTPFKRVEDLPIQGTAHNARGTVALRAKWCEGMADLEGFDRIWLIYFSPQADNSAVRIVPRLDGQQRGVFATRSLRRPNGIGLTCVRLTRVRGATLQVEGVDMLDGSQLLDVKPYVPRYDAYPEAWAGWLEHRVPHERAWQERLEPGQSHSV